VTDDGREGWGEAVPVKEVTGERRADVRQALERVARERLVGADPVDREPLRDVLGRDLARLPSARCAADTALWDLRSQAWNTPLRRALGGSREALRASVTIGIMSTEDTVAMALQRVSEGFADLKLKIGRDAGADIERVKAVRGAVDEAIRIYLDANQGYSTADALAVVAALGGQTIELIEQPVKADDLAGLAEVSRNSVIPVAADEAVIGTASLMKVLDARAARLVNIKLQKCGGPTEAEWMLRTAESAGVRGMIGCMIETRIGITAGLSVALGANNVGYIDLDGAFDHEADVVSRGGAQLATGLQSLEDRPGLGVSVNRTVVETFADEDLEDE
jgi:L-alanine-DL-glutamate epimerase-like enolase superfamily enzyme